MLITERIEIGLSGKNIKYFEDLGYEIPRRKDKWGDINVPMGTKISVETKDLADNSKIKVEIECDNCGKIFTIGWGGYKKCVKEDEAYYCNSCVHNLYSAEKARITNLKHSISFYDWCIQNNFKEFLNRWNYELNIINPKDIAYSSHKKFYFNCNIDINHKPRNVSLHDIVANKTINCLECNSFYKWCMENNYQELLNRWDYTLNIVDPKEIACKCNNKCYFKCPKGLHESELFHICDITSNRIEAKCRKCNSFGQYLIDTYGDNAIDLYWANENKLNPFKIMKSSTKKVLINCQDKNYHESYEIQCCAFITGNRCPYCHGLKVHELDSLGTLFPQVLAVWSDKNKKFPYEFMPFSGSEIWWKCPEGKHEDYCRKISYSNTLDFRCPECSRERTESILEEKVRIYLSEDLGYKLNHEYDCSIIPQNPKTIDKRYQMPFDNEVISLRLIVEVNGEQHYNTHSYNSIWSDKILTPKEQLHKQQLHDRYKRYIAFRNGYFYLVIPYWTVKDESYKQLIIDKIKEIKQMVNAKSVA